MAEETLGATLIVSIDLTSGQSHHGDSRISDDHLVKSLAPLMARHHVSATWGFADPAQSPGLARLLAVAPDQEIALLGDVSAETASQRPLARRVADAVAQGGAAGYALSTLVLRRTLLGDGWRQVMRQGITAVSGAATVHDEAPVSSTAPRRTLGVAGDVGPRAIRYGLWEFPAQACLPWKTGLWTLATSSLRTRQAIDRATNAAGVVHLAIDAGAFCAAEPRVHRWLDRILEHAARRRSQERLEILSVAESVSRLAQTRRGEPSRSILHTADPERPLAA
ncbi:MAG: hypothetical protein KF708_15605 [Pirellulales bacterium]|nr:hypothetical protein [Pirellulales bacterium]